MLQSTLSPNMVLQGKFRCKVADCKAIFDNSALKVQHMSEFHQISDNCNNSSKGYEKNSVTDNNMPARLYICKINDCNLTFESSQLKRRHQYSVHKGKRIKCPVKSCKAMLKRKCLTSHIKSVHQKIRASCGKCGNKFNSSYVRLHEAKCTSEVSTTKVRKNAGESISRSKRPLHKQDKYLCGYKGCDKVFLSSKGRMSHFMWTHTKNVLCTFKNCNVKLPPAKLTRHIRIVHKGNNGEISQGPIPCKVIGCQLVFDSSSKRDSHMKESHKNAVKCPYPYCSVVLARSSLNRHNRNFHGKNMIKCKFCGIILPKHSLYNHQKQCQIKFKGLKRTVGASKVQKDFFRELKSFKCPLKNCNVVSGTLGSQKTHLYYKHHDPVSCPHQGCQVILKPGLLLSHVKNFHGQKDPVMFYLEGITMSQPDRQVGAPVPEPEIKQEVGSTNHEVAQAKPEAETTVPKVKKARGRSWKHRLPMISCGMGCDEKFFKESTRLIHIGKHHRDPMKCPFESCNFVANPSQIIRHQKYSHSAQPKKKTTIRERERRKKLLETSLKSLKRTIPCIHPSCGARFATESSREEHVKFHHKLSIPCPFEECDFTAESGKLVEHMKSEHSTIKTESNETNSENVSLDDSIAKRKRLMCLVQGCVAVFSNENSRTKHLGSQHLGQVSCPFPDCKVPLPSGILSMHMKVAHAEVKNELLENELPTPQDQVYLASKRVVEDHALKVSTKENLIVNKTAGGKQIDGEKIKKEPSVTKEAQIKSQVVKNVQTTKLRRQQIFDLPWMYKFMEQEKHNELREGVVYKCISATCPKQFGTPVRQSHHIYARHHKILVCPFKGCSHKARLGPMSQHYWYTHNPLNRSFDNARDKRNLAKVNVKNSVNISVHGPDENEDTKKTIKSEFSKEEKRSRLYKCNHRDCTVNFETASRRAEHEKLHQTLVLCPNGECKSLVPGLELNDHMENVHRNFKDRCYYCKKTFDWLKLPDHITCCKEKYA